MLVSSHAKLVVVLTLAALAAGCGSTGPDPAPSGATPRAATSNAAARALAFLDAHPDLALAGAGHAFAARAVLAEDDGAEHVRFDRTYRGVRVVGGDVVVHARPDGAFDRVTHTLRGPLPESTEPALAPDQAREAAGVDAASPAAELVVLARQGLSALAYDVVRSGEQEDGTPEELHVLVDAKTGRTLERWNAVTTAKGKGHGLYCGEVALTTSPMAGGFELADATRGGSETVDARGAEGTDDAPFTSAADAWGDGTAKDRSSAAVDAQYALATTWDYFAKVHGRHGPAGDGKGLLARVHFRRGYANAFYSPACDCVSLGDGKKHFANGVSMLPLVALDVVAHELTHAVTASTANLVYSGESGALNEATSDIFATMVEHYAKNPNDPPDYTIGEQVFEPKGYAIRDMAEPDVGCWDPTVGSLDPHLGSGVANHFFYLLAEGTTAKTHTCGGAKKLVGIGREAAARIWYRALTVYMTSDTGYADARKATLDAADDLYGAASPQHKRVAQAWTAVGVP
jgi:Zn-dependent metalloprotease